MVFGVQDAVYEVIIFTVGIVLQLHFIWIKIISWDGIGNGYSCELAVNAMLHTGK